jgi:putative phosphotransacetylase
MSEKKVLVEISARHVHVTQADLETLFGIGAVLHPKKIYHNQDNMLLKKK